MFFQYVLFKSAPEPQRVYQLLRRTGFSVLGVGVKYERWHEGLKHQVAPWLVAEARRINPQLDLDLTGLEVARGERPAILDYDFRADGQS